MQSSKVKEKERTIGGKAYVCKELAAERIGMKVPTLNKLIAMCKSPILRKKVIVPIKFYQTAKNAPIWFDLEDLDEFVETVKETGRAY